jgi:8-amino-7-oxononanoate synthase
MDLFKKCDEFTKVDELKSKGIYPYFHELQTKQDVEVTMGGQHLIMMGSNNYLGLTCHPEVIKEGSRAIKKFGSGCSGSRFLNGTLTLHTKFERDLATFLRKQAVVTFSTGFQTNLGIISAIVGRADLIFCDKDNHASIYDGCKLSWGQMIRYEHSDMAGLENALKNADKNKGKLIVTDGVFSMSGDICKLPEIVKLAKKYEARVMVDDAHALGVLGDHGRGTADYFGLTDEVDIIMGTFSKSLASMGGYCACSAKVAEFIRHNSRPYMFCASIPPSNIACANKALDIIKTDDSRIKSLLYIAKYVRKGLAKRGIKYRSTNDIIPIIPIYTYTMEKTLVVCKALFEAGVYVNPVLPPATPEGECLIRTSYMATHTPELMDKAMDIIAEVFKEVGVTDSL